MQLQNSDQATDSSVAYNDNFLPKKLDGQLTKIDFLFAKAGLEPLSASTKNDGRQSDSASSESPSINWPEPPSIPWFQIFDRRDFIAAENLIEIALHSGRDSAEGLKCALRTIIDRGEFRPLPNIDSEIIKSQIAYLREKFPNFSLVLDDVDAAFAIAELAGGHPILSPMLFVGSPGVGKSLFAAELATVLDTQPARLLQMSTAQSNSALSGSEAFWSNTKSGLIFDSLIFGETATPVLRIA